MDDGYKGCGSTSCALWRPIGAQLNNGPCRCRRIIQEQAEENETLRARLAELEEVDLHAGMMAVACERHVESDACTCAGEPFQMCFRCKADRAIREYRNAYSGVAE